MRPHQDYFDAVTRCMMTFQTIEEMIKMVLIRLETLIYFRVRQLTHYDLKPKFSTIQNSAMGRLIDMLKNFTDDQEMLTELRSIKKERDNLAHQGLLFSIEEANDVNGFVEKTANLEALDKRAVNMLTKIVDRWRDLDAVIALEAAGSKRPDK